MGATIKIFLQNLRRKDTLSTLIIINVAIFLLLAIFRVIAKLFGLPFTEFLDFIAVSSNVKLFFTHIWAAFTYMFVHYEIFHILFNMLMLYWFGKIFMMYFTSKNLVALYILGGLAGAFFFVLTFNTIPYFIQQGSTCMVGASASVTAVIFASAFYNKNLEVRLLFFGSIKIVYIALIIFVIDFISLSNDSNLGGHIAHIGGAIFGYIFAIQFLKGKDLTRGFNKMIDFVVNSFKKKPKMRVKYKKPESDYEYNQRKYKDSEEIDHILDKIKQSGYKSLNENEKKRLFDASNK